MDSKQSSWIRARRFGGQHGAATEFYRRAGSDDKLIAIGMDPSQPDLIRDGAAKKFGYGSALGLNHVSIGGREPGINAV